jgi:hypothetical protein
MACLMSPAPLINLAESRVIKELRNYNRYGDTFRDKYWIASIIIILTITGMYYSIAVTLSKQPQFIFSSPDYAILISEFNGDLENLVQRQIIENLRTSIYSDDNLKNIRIEPLKMQIHVHDDALAMLRKTKANTFIWRSFVPKSIDYCNVSTSLSQNMGRVVINQFPDVEALESSILKQIRSIGIRMDPIESQLKKIQDEFGTLHRTIDLLRLRVEGLESH